ncbi:MAG: succinate dehydrogenase/fumarate reductase iron-sulfur subunit [Desulfobacterales bacterium]|nr:MAG: succinate dehydrogenase/fumarate reductase iron-sulfur subunit [Desulfobacterales bacterium]
MPIKKLTFKILRYKPDRIDPPRFQEFTLEADTDISVLDALEKIRHKQDNTLMYRHSCHHSSCGTCACKINGKERLTCITKIQELPGDTIELTPLEGFEPIGDLVVDVSRLYGDLPDDWSYLRKSEEVKSTARPQGIRQFTRFENCIECGACVSACPVTEKNAAFLGPAVLAALNSELQKSPQKESYLTSLAGSKRGHHLCERALNCSRVCPTAVYPARHIADLRRMLEEDN